MFSSQRNEEHSQNNTPQISKEVYLLHKEGEHIDGVDTGRSRQEVCEEMRQRTATFVQELKDFIIANNLEQDIDIKNVMEFIGIVVVEATAKGRQELESMKDVHLSENHEVRLIEPVIDNEARFPKRPDSLDDR